MPHPKTARRIIIAATTALALSAGLLTAPVHAASKSGSLSCGTRLLAAQAGGYRTVTAIAAGKRNVGYTPNPINITVKVISDSHSGSWSGTADNYLQTSLTYGYCYG